MSGPGATTAGDATTASAASGAGAALTAPALAPPLEPETQRGWAFARGARASFVFLTRVPVGGFPYSRADFAWAPAHFPLVGLVIGGASAALWWLSAPLGSWISATLAVTLSVWLTGAFHEDGLADTADALGGAHGTKRILDILKDSRIGAFGAIALVLSQLLRVAALAELGTLRPTPWLALPFAHALARTAPVWLMATLPYVTGPEAKGSAVAAGNKLPQALVASSYALMTLGAVYALGVPLLACGASFAVAAVCTLLLGRWFRARLGGIAGDLLGAAEQVLEIALLLTWLACARAGAL